MTRYIMTIDEAAALAADLTAFAEELRDFEGKVSALRQAAFDVIDALQAEITRRYRTGEASVETLLET